MRTPRSAFIAVAVLAVASFACRTTAGKGGAGSPGVARTVEGRVEQVGRDDGTLTLRIGDERKEVLVAPEAEIRLDDFKGTFEDLEEGQRVRAALEEVEGKTEGFRIEILDQGVKEPGVSAKREGAERPSSPEAAQEQR